MKLKMVTVNAPFRKHLENDNKMHFPWCPAAPAVLGTSKLCLGTVTINCIFVTGNWATSQTHSCQWPRCQHQQYTPLCSRNLHNTTTQASNNACGNALPLHCQISHHWGHQLLTWCQKSQTLHLWCQLIHLISTFLLTYLYILMIHSQHPILILIASSRYWILRWNTTWTGSDAIVNYWTKFQQLVFSTLHCLYQNHPSSIFWIIGGFITPNAFAANFMSSHRPSTVLSAALKTTPSFTTTQTTASCQYIFSYTSSSSVLGIMEMPLLLRILLSGPEFWLVELRNVQIVSSSPFFHVMMKQSISLMPRKRKVWSRMLIGLCVLNGMVVFC